MMTHDKSRALGFDACLRKPFGLHNLSLAIQEALAQRALQKPCGMWHTGPLVALFLIGVLRLVAS